MAQQACADPCIFHGDHVGKAQDFGRAGGKVSKVADRPCNDVKPSLKPRTIKINNISFHKDAR